MSTGSDQAPLPPRVDLYVAAVLLALGLGVMALAWRMPTFVEQSGTGLTAPGIVPGFHGTVVAVLAVLLGLRAIRQGALKADAARAGTWSGEDARQLGTAAGLGVLYAGVMVGTLPFWLATALFVFGFTAAFEWSLGPERRMRRLAEAAVLGLATGGIVTLVFERIFLVRLP
ncbi:tripartite tricarboxylate transporter TctB family protein [Falsiroseomonas sp.]|uniref:tripartite tricarboxylate transporter TctB family protein n=1 Tax=Falsiroseomonas sp. TaxID=2870721 RepID=UPI003F7276A9